MVVPKDDALEKKDTTQYVIQYLRGIAAVLVVFHHTAYQIDANLGAQSLSWISSRFAAIGAGGVDVFFVISGFIIFYTMPVESSWRRAASFIWHRFTRVVPLYWFWTSVLIIIILAGVALRQMRLDPGMIAASYALIPYEKSPGNFHPILDQGWTLSFEMYFYAVTAVLIATLDLPRRLVALFAVLTLVMLIAHAGYLPPALKQWLGSFLVYEFFAGAAIASFFRSAAGQDAIGRHQRLGMIMMAVGSSAFLASVFLSDAAGQRIIFWGAPSAMMVFGAILANAPPRTWIGRTAFWVGTASYSLYLTHTLFTITMGGLLKRGLVPGAFPDALLVIATLGIVVAGSATYPVIERPLLAVFRRKRQPPYEAVRVSEV